MCFKQKNSFSNLFILVFLSPTVVDNEIPLRASPPPTEPYILRFWFIVYLLFLGKRTYTSPFILSNFPNKTEKTFTLTWIARSKTGYFGMKLDSLEIINFSKFISAVHRFLQSYCRRIRQRFWQHKQRWIVPMQRLN